jgi:predicted ABC-type ATPase
MPMQSPTLYLVGGCNGAGKTTFAKTYFGSIAPQPRFHNADLLAQGLSPLRPEALAMKAGRLLLREIHSSVLARESFVLESTLSGRTYVRLLTDAKSAGYEIELHYLWLGNPQVAVQRVKQRVLEGGHDVPIDAILRRKSRSETHLIESYAPLANRWVVYDNEVVPPRLIASSETNHVDELRKIFAHE